MDCGPQEALGQSLAPSCSAEGLNLLFFHVRAARPLLFGLFHHPENVIVAWKRMRMGSSPGGKYFRGGKGTCPSSESTSEAQEDQSQRQGAGFLWMLSFHFQERGTSLCDFFPRCLEGGLNFLPCHHFFSLGDLLLESLPLRWGLYEPPRSSLKELHHSPSFSTPSSGKNAGWLVDPWESTPMILLGRVDWCGEKPTLRRRRYQG